MLGSGGGGGEVVRHKLKLNAQIVNIKHVYMVAAVWVRQFPVTCWSGLDGRCGRWLWWGLPVLGFTAVGWWDLGFSKVIE